MCKIYTDKITHIKTGYKVIAVKDSKFYSIFLGTEFKIGKVEPIDPNADGIFRRITYNWNSGVDYLKPIQWSFYNKDFNGKTAAFINKDDAISLFNLIMRVSVKEGYTIKIAKIVFKDNTILGSFNIVNDEDTQVIAGSIIKSITICEDLTNY